MSPELSFSCPRCFIGHCHPGVAVYVRMYSDMLLSAMDMPAYVCDVCGYQEFDESALVQLEELLNDRSEADAGTTASSSVASVDVSERERSEAPKTRSPKI